MVNISMLIISTIWFMFNLSVSSVPRPCPYMLGLSSLTRVFRMCKPVLHPLSVNVELITPDHHVMSQHEELSQWCILGENTYTLKFSKGSSYNATAVLSKIRCKKINITCNQNMWPDMAIIILCFWSHLQSIVMISIVTGSTPWSPSLRRGRLANYCFYNYP